MATSFRVRRRERLHFGSGTQGARAYVAIAGGVQTPAVLGSRATQLVSRMGGLEAARSSPAIGCRLSRRSPAAATERPWA